MTESNNPIVKKIPGKVTKYIVRKILTDEETKGLLRVFLEPHHFKVVLDHDADVYSEDGQLLVRFRKGVLSKKKIDQMYDAIQEVIKHASTDRGIASGSSLGRATGQKNRVFSNIIGYFDKWSVYQKAIFKKAGMKPPSQCRFTSFTAREPEKWKQCIPLIEEIDQQYKRLCPKEHTSQLKAARTTPFRIGNTSFSTITTNLNFRTAAHHDTGDWEEGFGNLVVIERGTPYKGAHTGFPQYGVAVDCREGDFLAMDVHQLHGNSPMIPGDDTSQRISLVSYLREAIVKKCAGEKLYDAQALEKKLEKYRAGWGKTARAKKQTQAKQTGGKTRKNKTFFSFLGF
jgi:hypothetical protein